MGECDLVTCFVFCPCIFNLRGSGLLPTIEVRVLRPKKDKEKGAPGERGGSGKSGVYAGLGGLGFGSEEDSMMVLSRESFEDFREECCGLDQVMSWNMS